VLPDMPIRLEAETIINDCNLQYKDELLERSMTFTSSIVDVAYRDGFYRDGRSNIPISERARRVYVPDMPPFQGEADRHPNLLTEEYLEEQRKRPKSQGSVLGERSAKVRAANNRATTARELKNQSAPSSPMKPGNQEDRASLQDVFSDYYEGLLPLNGVGEIEPESKFQLFLVGKQQDRTRASTAPPKLGPRGDDDQCDDSMAFEDSTTFEASEHSIKGHASYASTLSRDMEDNCDDSLVSDWQHEEQSVSRPPPSKSKNHNHYNNNGQIVQSVDMLFP
jgi:hypothetical protein